MTSSKLLPTRAKFGTFAIRIHIGSCYKSAQEFKEMWPNVQKDPTWLSNFNNEAPTFYKEIPFPTKDMSSQLEMNSTMEGWKTLRQEDDIRQKVPTLELIASNENQFIVWSNDMVEAIESVIFSNWMKLSHLNKESQIPNETQEMQDSGDDKSYAHESIMPFQCSMME